VERVIQLQLSDAERKALEVSVKHIRERFDALKANAPR
jgi:malate/lactate dehydrogenase